MKVGRIICLAAVACAVLSACAAGTTECATIPPTATDVPTSTTTAEPSPTRQPSATPTRASTRTPRPSPTPVPATATLEPPVIHSFSVEPARAYPGDTVTLSWSSTGAETAYVGVGKPGGYLGSGVIGEPTDTVQYEISDGDRYWQELRLVVTSEAGATAEAVQRLILLCPYEWFFAHQESRTSCPLRPAVYVAAAEQVFENGRMLWLNTGPSRSGPVIYVLSDYPPTSGGRNIYGVYDDTWTEGEPDNDPSIANPEGLLQPIRGFGKVWRTEPGVRERLGWAVSPEQGYGGAYQLGWYPYGPGSTYYRAADGGAIWINRWWSWGFVPGSQ